MKRLHKLLFFSLLFMSSSIYSMLSNLKHTARLTPAMQNRMMSKIIKTPELILNGIIIQCDNRIQVKAIKTAHQHDWEQAKDLFEMAYIYKHDAVIKSNPNYEAAQDAVIAGKFGKAKDLLDQGLQIFNE